MGHNDFLKGGEGPAALRHQDPHIVGQQAILMPDGSLGEGCLHTF
jgi:hypothetical protein